MNLRSVGLRAALVLFVVHGAYGFWRDRPAHPPSGILAPNEPIQLAIEGAPQILLGHWQLMPRASYDITARVLGRERYRFDHIAGLAPLDLALGWGPMSDNKILKPISVSQGARFYTLHWTASLPTPPNELMLHSANTHIIPATEALAGRLERLRVGEIVHLTGQLVDAERTDGSWSIHTSLRRDDTGDGACEVMRVETLDILPQGNL
jgi:hypothetical protein